MRPPIKRPVQGDKIDFIIAGAQKSGTTALAAYLRQHPNVFVAQSEPHFFDTDEYFQSAEIDYKTYHRGFNPAIEQHCIGENTPIYLYWKLAAKRIQSYNPAIKILILLRCPVARAYSAWNMERNRGGDELSFAEAIKDEASRIKLVEPLQHRVFSYVDRGFYARQLERLWRHIPRAQTLVLPSKQFKQAPQMALDKVCAFLELPSFQQFKFHDVHVGSYESTLSDEVNKHLQSIFHAENHRLEQLLGWNSEDWLG